MVNIIPPDGKNFGNIEKFARRIKGWKPKNCPYKFCKLAIEVLWQIERVSALAGDLTMTASALTHVIHNCRIFKLCVFKCKKKMFYYCKFNVFNPFFPNAPFLYPLKTSEKLYCFLMFPECRERVPGNGLSFWIIWGLFCKYDLQNSSFHLWNKSSHNNNKFKILKILPWKEEVSLHPSSNICNFRWMECYFCYVLFLKCCNAIWHRSLWRLITISLSDAQLLNV